MSTLTDNNFHSVDLGTSLPNIEKEETRAQQHPYSQDSERCHKNRWFFGVLSHALTCLVFGYNITSAKEEEQSEDKKIHTATNGCLC